MRSRAAGLGAAVVVSTMALLCALIVATGSVAALVLTAVVLVLGIGVTFPMASRSRSPMLWWMHPAWTMTFAVAPGLLLSAALSSTYFLGQWGTPKFITPHDLYLIGGLAVAFCAGTWVAIRIASPRPPHGDPSLRATPALIWRLERAGRSLFWLTVAGYVLWTLVGLSRGLRAAELSAVFTGSVHTVKGYLAPVAGVTTLTQFGPLSAVCFMLLRRTDSHVRANRYLVALFALALIRTLVYAERLAVIEIAIPVLIVALALPRRGTPVIRRAILTLLPLWAPVALLIFFGSFEYFRSWSSSYYQGQYAGRGYATFVVNRLGAYYGTAMNNGVLQLQSDERASHVPFFVLRWLWKFPVIDQVTPYAQLSGSNVGPDYATTLKARANPEFNNEAGILLPVFDLGTVGAAAFWFCAGLATGVAFALFKERDITGLVVYPVLYLGLLEAGRELYWTDGRAMPSILGAVVLGWVLRGSSKHQSGRQSPQAAVAALSTPRSV